MSLIELDNGPMTVDQFDALREEMPDDGRRLELIDGVLIVSPAPAFDHQRLLRELVLLMHPACPAELEVLFAPFDVRLDRFTNLQPDLLVAPVGDFTEKNLPVAPLLAVEVLSPSTRRHDLHTKRARYEDAECASYWVIDPKEPSLTAWELVDGAYDQVAQAVGEETWRAASPYPVEITPADLVRRSG